MGNISTFFCYFCFPLDWLLGELGTRKNCIVTGLYGTFIFCYSFWKLKNERKGVCSYIYFPYLFIYLFSTNPLLWGKQKSKLEACCKFVKVYFSFWENLFQQQNRIKGKKKKKAKNEDKHIYDIIYGI